MFETYVAFFLVSLLLALTPGPDIVFVLAQSVAWGARAGVLITLGLCTGLVFHTLAVALGVAVFIQTTPLAFDLIKYAGALYLLYLAVMAWRADALTAGQSAPQIPAAKLYQRGVVMNLTNPKVLVFFLAFLPQFTDLQQGGVTVQIMWLGLLFMLAALLVFCSVALLAGFVGRRINPSGNAQRYLNRLAAIIFVLLAVNVLWVSTATAAAPISAATLAVQNPATL